MSEHPCTSPQSEPDQSEKNEQALWERRMLRWDMADAGRAAWTPEAAHCADPADCPTYRAALASLGLDPDPDFSTAPEPTPDPTPRRRAGLTAADLTSAWRAGYDDAADTYAAAERWERVLAVMEHRSPREVLGW